MCTRAYPSCPTCKSQTNQTPVRHTRHAACQNNTPPYCTRPRRTSPCQLWVKWASPDIISWSAAPPNPHPRKSRTRRIAPFDPAQQPIRQPDNPSAHPLFPMPTLFHMLDDVVQYAPFAIKIEDEQPRELFAAAGSRGLRHPNGGSRGFVRFTAGLCSAMLVYPVRIWGLVSA